MSAGGRDDGSVEGAFGLLWGLSSLAGLGAIGLAPRLAPLLPPCHVKAATGIPCPTCGLTRAVIALADGDVATAFLLQPLGLVLLVACVVGGVLYGAAALAGRPLPIPLDRLDRRVLLTIALVGVANWLYLIVDGR